MRTRTQPVMAEGIAEGALLLETDEQGHELTWRVLSADRHPLKHDHVVVSGGDGSGRIRVLHVSDWVLRVIES